MMPRRFVEQADNVELMRLFNNQNTVAKWYKLRHTSGTATGTGVQQTIRHGLVATPSNVTFDAPVASTVRICAWQSAPADSVNIYVATINTQSFRWFAEV